MKNPFDIENEEDNELFKNGYEREFGENANLEKIKKERSESERVSGVPRKVFILDHEKIKTLQYKNLSDGIKVYDILEDLLEKMDNPKIIADLEKRFEEETKKKEKAPETKNIRVTHDFINFTKNFTTVDRGNRFYGTKKLDFKTVFSTILDEYLKKYTKY